ncbi:hypothetical protein JCM8547_009045 [Rhodosporidiobolus lusitaniae]
MPVELLAEIFRLAYGDESRSTGPICRALLPFDRASRFRQVEVKSLEQLARLVQLVEGNKEIGTFVTSLSLRDGDAPEVTLNGVNEVLERFLPLLPRLETLSVDFVDARDVDEAVFAALPFACPSLHTLIFPWSWPDPSDPDLYAALAACPSLRTLELFCERADYASRHKRQIARPGSATLPFTSLTLGGYWLDDSGFARLANSCPLLSDLHLEHDSDDPAFDEILPALPPSLTSLYIVVEDAIEGPPCDHLLPRFHRLTHLYPDGPFTNPLTLADNLRRLPSLTSISFLPGCTVDADALLTLVSGPHRHPALRTLSLNLFFPGVKRLVEAGRENGIVIDGGAVEALETYHKFYADWRKVVVYGQGEGGDFSELREFLGAEEAEKELGARGIVV